MHYKLIDLGFSQRAAVSILLTFSAIFGISAILFSMRRYLACAISAACAIVVLFTIYFVFRAKSKRLSAEKQNEDRAE